MPVSCSSRCQQLILNSECTNFYECTKFFHIFFLKFSFLFKTKELYCYFLSILVSFQNFYQIEKKYCKKWIDTETRIDWCHVMKKLFYYPNYLQMTGAWKRPCLASVVGYTASLHCTVGMYVVVWKTEGPVGIVVLSVLFCNREMPKTSFEAFLCSVGAFTMAEIAQVCPKTMY